MRTNFHTHTYRCKHAVGTELDYVTEAVNKGLSILGFSDHGPFKDNRYGLRMDFSSLEPYIDTVNELKRTKMNEITIYSGLEIEYDPKDESYYQELLADYRLDYLALAQHFYVTDTGTPINIYSVTDTVQYIDYANSIVNGMATGYFKFVAHPDIMFVNDLPWDDNCEMACDIIISAAAANNYILEYNANGYRRGIHQFIDGERLQYPHPKFWEKAAGTSVPVIVGSDCHNPIQIWDEHMEYACKAVKEYRLNVITEIF